MRLRLAAAGVKLQLFSLYVSLYASKHAILSLYDHEEGQGSCSTASPEPRREKRRGCKSSLLMSPSELKGGKSSAGLLWGFHEQGLLISSLVLTTARA